MTAADGWCDSLSVLFTLPKVKNIVYLVGQVFIYERGQHGATNWVYAPKTFLSHLRSVDRKMSHVQIKLFCNNGFFLIMGFFFFLKRIRFDATFLTFGIARAKTCGNSFNFRRN